VTLDTDRRIVVLSWFDLYEFDGGATITCPDCSTRSGHLRDVWEAVKWCEDHHRVCMA